MVLVDPSGAWPSKAPLLQTLKRLVVRLTPNGGGREEEAESTLNTYFSVVMAISVGCQPLTEVGQPVLFARPVMSYAGSLKPATISVKPLSLKPIS
ncbi:hypothetical protein H5410_047044 [Solanum commersonii]|uniref:Uncharacterized protein n=1 Tax=Solanum commersonii TaxID=4109 RepID=A0A9J5XG29_SOLCO|nr:hypothetical protein H5410_047044 [Solanum commersonii]